ncbi:MAG: DUF1353 domain-containing protein [Gallionella sp.]
MERILYKKGYKYQLFEEYQTDIPIMLDQDIFSRGHYVTLSKEGRIVIKKGYAWDGPSGPTIDTLNFMRGSLVHDALYQFIREQKLVKHIHRDQADKLLQKMCKEDGMSSIRAWLVYHGVSKFGGSAADPTNIKVVIKAPKSYR